MCWKWLSYITNTSETVHFRFWSGIFRIGELTFHFFKFLYIHFVSLPIIMIDPNVRLTFVCYNNCFGPSPYFFLCFYNHSKSRFENTVYEFCEDSGCDYSFHHQILKWQESHPVFEATLLFLVLQADAVDKQQTLSDNFKVRHPVLFLYN